MKVPPSAARWKVDGSRWRLHDSSPDKAADGDSGTKTQGDASSKQPADGAAPTGDDGGPATPPTPAACPARSRICPVQWRALRRETWLLLLRHLDQPRHHAGVGLQSPAFGLLGTHDRMR